MSTTVAATFVFTDLVNSTALSSSVSVSEADELRRTHFDLLRTVVSATGGTEVKNLGDGLMIVFPSPSRALACAVGMQQSIHTHNARDAVPLAIRVGVATGEAVEEDGDYFGTPVIEAARLCARADGGQILATDLVRLTVGRGATHEMVSVGALELKGLPEPVDAFEVQWEPEQLGDDAPWPLPERLVRGATESLFGFFGRADAMAQVEAAHKESATSGRVHVVLISGEPGLGKTTLAAHAARAVHGADTNVTFGSCDDGLAVPYRPWIGALQHIVRYGGPGLAERLPVAQRQALVRLVPEIDGEASARTQSDSDTDQFALFEAVARALAIACEARPLLIVLDDLHWADAGTVQLLRHLVVHAGKMPLLLVATYRDSDLTRAHPMTSLLADLHREQSVTRIAMTGLSDADLITLMEAAAGHELDDAGVGLAHALRRETDGNPFFVAEMLRHLGESGEIYLDDRYRYTLRSSLAELGLPTSVRDVVARRVARLGPESERVLAAGAVLGRDFDVDVLSGLADVDEDTLVDLLELAVGAAVLTESPTVAGRFRFAHALIQHTLYQEMGATRRQRLHQRAGQVLEDLRGDADAQVPELAHHWLAATKTSDSERALRYTERAGDLALVALAPNDAIRWYRQAMELLDREPERDPLARCALLVRLGRAQMIAGEPDGRATLLDAGAIAGRLGAADLIVGAALAATRGYFSNGTAEDAELTALTIAALDAVGDTETSDRVRLLCALTEHTGASDWRVARERAQSALDAARRLGDERLLMEATLATYSACSCPDLLAQRLTDAERALKIADAIGNPVDRFDSRYNRHQAALEMGDRERAEGLMTEMAALVESADLTLPFVRLRMLLVRAGHAMLDGDLEDAERAADDLLELSGGANVPEALAAWGGVLAMVRYEQGRVDEVVDLFSEAVNENMELPVLRALVSLFNCELGRHDDARALLAVDKATHFAKLPFDTTWKTGMMLYADSAAMLGDEDAAAAIRSRLDPYLDTHSYDTLMTWGAVGRCAGKLDALLGNDELADAELRDALAFNTAMRAPFLIALTQLDYADVLFRRTRPGVEQATALAEAAAALAARHGYAGIGARAARRLERLA